MRYFYKNGKMYEIDERQNKKENLKGCLTRLFYLLIFIIVVNIGEKIYNGHKTDKYKQTSYTERQLFSNSTVNSSSKIYELPYNVYQKIKDNNTPEFEVIDTYYSDLGKFILKAGNKKNYGLRHILARHTRRYYPDYRKAISLFDDDITANDIVEKLDYFFDHCVKVYLQKKAPYNDSRGVCLGYIKHNGRLIRCLLVYRTSDNSIITFYPLTKQNELNMLDSWRRRYLD